MYWPPRSLTNTQEHLRPTLRATHSLHKEAPGAKTSWCFTKTQIYFRLQPLFFAWSQNEKKKKKKSLEEALALGVERDRREGADVDAPATLVEDDVTEERP